MLAGAVSTLQRPRKPSALEEESGEQAGGCPKPFWPNRLRAAGSARGLLYHKVGSAHRHHKPEAETSTAHAFGQPF